MIGIKTLLGRSAARPWLLRLEASSNCQLACPSCPTAQGLTRPVLGRGFLQPADFVRILDQNPWISRVELSNYGEIFLNPQLPEILRAAWRRNVALQATNGSNLNHLPDSSAEAIVRYRLRNLTCSIDGASAETYGQYRKKGDFAAVMENLSKIDFYKRKYASAYPKLNWQFVIFGHNEHELATARAMARERGMDWTPKLSWDEGFSPIRDEALVKRETGFSVVRRSDEPGKAGDTRRAWSACSQLWFSPQVNSDGRILGCCVNYWGDFGHCDDEPIGTELDTERLRYARRMLLGKEGDRKDIPCSSCHYYQEMLVRRSFLAWNWRRATADRLRPRGRLGRVLNRLEMGWDEARSAWKQRKVSRSDSRSPND